MQKNITRNIQKGKARYKALQDKSVNRFQQNASRLEHSNVEGSRSRTKAKF